MESNKFNHITSTHNSKQEHNVTFFTFLIMAITLTLFQTNSSFPQSLETLEFESNKPMGEAKGIMPGRVTWAHNPDATNENADPNDWINNTNLEAVESMVKNSIHSLSGKSNLIEGWEELFKYFNKEHNKGAVGYQEGEEIFIKLNLTATRSADQNYNLRRLNVVRTSPEVVLVILRHLINELNIPQEKISVGDPQHCVVNPWWDLLHPEFPNVKYIDNRGEKGRTLAIKGTNVDIKYSDRGKVLRTGGQNFSDPANQGDPIYQDSFYKVIEEADYMINIAVMKGHYRAGVTFTAKNHFGSHTREKALHLHMGLVAPDGIGGATVREGYGLYRVLVDLMGNKYLGGNTLLFVVDGLWATPDMGVPPEKFEMTPFNGDYTSSIFMSQDEVALESVCFDFMRSEFNKESNHTKFYPQIYGVDDYLRQAANPANWPEGIIYDPEDDGIPLNSLGAHEHWNNPLDKKYSRNLGKSIGIDLHRVK